MLLLAVLDSDRGGSLLSVVRSLLRVARMMRERISADTWRVLTSLDDEMRSLAEPVTDLGGPIAGALERGMAKGLASGLAGGLDRTIMTLAGFQGLAMESMTRGQAWRFLDMGRRLERALSVLLLLRNTLTERCPREAPLLRGDPGSRRQRHDLPPPLPRPICRRPRFWICCSPTRPTHAR